MAEQRPLRLDELEEYIRWLERSLEESRRCLSYCGRQNNRALPFTAYSSFKNCEKFVNSMTDNLAKARRRIDDEENQAIAEAKKIVKKKP